MEKAAELQRKIVRPNGLVSISFLLLARDEHRAQATPQAHHFCMN
jgi:hypothetical protein